MIKRIILISIFLLKISFVGYGQTCKLTVAIKSSSTLICTGGSVTLTAEGTGADGHYTYQWSTGETTQTISTTHAGTYSVTLKSSADSCASLEERATITLTGSIAPEMPIATGVTICANTTANLNVSGSTSNFRWYDTANGGKIISTNQSFITPNLTANTTYYVSQITPEGCESPRARVEVIVKPVPNAPASKNVSICEGNTATLTANGALNYQWYDAPSGGNLLGSEQTFTTPVLNSTKTYYVETTLDGCISSRKPVTVFVSPLPVTPIVPDYTICYGSTVNLSISNITPGNVYRWYDVPTGGIPLITSVDFTTPALKATTTFYVQSFLNDCTSPRLPIKITVNPIPPNPIASGTTTCSGSSVTLSASGSFGTYKWFDTSFGDTPIATGESFQTPLLNYTTTFYVQTSEDGCSSNRIPVKVVVNQAPLAPSVPGRVICFGNFTTLTATAPAGTFEWYDAEKGGNLLASGSDFKTPALTADTRFYVQNIVAGCVGLRAEVKVTVLQEIPAPIVNETSVCLGESAVLKVSGGLNYKWYDQASGGLLLSSSSTFITPPLTANRIFYVQAENNGCKSQRTPVQITVVEVPTIPSAADVEICSNTTASLSATGNGTLEWFDVKTGGNVLHVGNNFITPTLTTETTFYVQTKNGTCASERLPVKVKIFPLNGLAFIFDRTTFCISESIASPKILDPLGGVFTASPAGLLINPSTGEVDISGSKVGVYTISFRSNGRCNEVTTFLLEITVGTNANFQFDSSYCQSASEAIPTFLNGGSRGIFTALPAGLVFKSTQTGEIDLKKSAAGTYIITNTLKNPCVSDSKSAQVVIEPTAVVDAGPDQIVAKNSGVSLSGTFSMAPGVTWSGGKGTFSNPLSPNTVYTPAADETEVKLTLTANSLPGKCLPTTDDLNLSIRTLPAAPTVSDALVCKGSSTFLTATSPGGNYQWYDAASNGKLLYSGSTFDTGIINTSTTFFVQTTVNGLQSSRTPVLVNVIQSMPDPQINNVAICYGGQATLSVNEFADTYEWFDAAVDGNKLSIGSKFITPSLFTNTSYYVQAKSGNCTSKLIKVDVTVNPLPSITSASEINACSNNAIGYRVTADVPKTTFLWSREAVSNISNLAVSGQSSDVINESLINIGSIPVNVTYLITPQANGCNGSQFRLVVTVYPEVSVTSASTQTICNNNAPSYSITFKNRPAFVSWSREAVPGITNATVYAQQAGTIREILNNSSDKAIDVKYDYIIYADFCPPIKFQYIVTVNPTIFITSANRGNDVCSGEAQKYQIKANYPNATFTWSRAAKTEITNEAKSGNTTVIEEALFCATPYPNTVDYLITPFYEGCAGNPFTYSVTVYPIPVAPAISSNSPVCLKSTLNLSTPVEDGLSYSWTGPNGFTSNLSNPKILNVSKTNEGIYTLIVTRRNCVSASSTVTVKVNEPSTASAGSNQILCSNIPSVSLNGKITGGAASGIWSTNGTGTFSPSNTQVDAQYIPSTQDKTAGTVILTLTTSSPDDCIPTSSSISVTFNSAPTVDAGLDQEVCIQDASVMVKGKVSSGAIAYWSTSGSGTFTDGMKATGANYLPSAKDKKTGMIKLALHATNNSCSNEVIDEIIVKFTAPPAVKIDNQITLIRNTTVQLNPSVSEENVKYSWSPAKHIDNANVRNPTITGVENLTYTLTVTDSRGCVTTSQVNVNVLAPIEFPNTFTPNGDGINDQWKIPALKDYPDATLNIFSRYGQQVFNGGANMAVWDGSKNGEPLPSGAYYFVIDTKFQKKLFSGSITIIR